MKLFKRSFDVVAFAFGIFLLPIWVLMALLAELIDLVSWIFRKP